MTTINVDSIQDIDIRQMFYDIVLEQNRFDIIDLILDELEKKYDTEEDFRAFADKYVNTFAEATLDVLGSEASSDTVLNLIEGDFELLIFHYMCLRKEWNKYNYYESVLDHLKKDIPSLKDIEFKFDLFDAEKEDQEEDKGTHYKTSTSDTNYYFKDKVTKSLHKLTPNVKTPISMENRKDRKKGNEITTYATINIGGLAEELEEVGSKASDLLKKLTKEEVQILNGVLTEWENGNTTTTVRNIFRSANKNQSAKPSKEDEAQVLKTLKKLNNYSLTIDATAESKYYGEAIKGEMYGSLLSIAIDTAYINSTLVYDAVHILDFDKTPIYRYAKIKKQIASVSSKALGRGVDSEVETRVNRTKGTGKIEDYLIERIESIPRLTSTILISSILEAADITEDKYKNFKDKKAKTIKKIHTILDNWTTTGYIKGYKDNKKGNRLHSITIKK